MRLPPGLCPGPSWGAYSALTPQLEKVGSHTKLDHPVEKSFPRHCVVDVAPDDGLVETADTPAEPGVQPDPAVQVAPIAPPVKHTRCGRLVRPPVRFDQLPD